MRGTRGNNRYTKRARANNVRPYKELPRQPDILYDYLLL